VFGLSELERPRSLFPTLQVGWIPGISVFN